MLQCYSGRGLHHPKVTLIHSTIIHAIEALRTKVHRWSSETCTAALHLIWWMWFFFWLRCSERCKITREKESCLQQHLNLLQAWRCTGRPFSHFIVLFFLRLRFWYLQGLLLIIMQSMTSNVWVIHPFLLDWHRATMKAILLSMKVFSDLHSLMPLMFIIILSQLWEPFCGSMCFLMKSL